MDAHQIKAHLMNFRFLFIVPILNHGLFEIFWLAEGHPKNTVVMDSPAALNLPMPSFPTNSPFSVTDFFQMTFSQELAFVLPV